MKVASPFSVTSEKGVTSSKEGKRRGRGEYLVTAGVVLGDSELRGGLKYSRGVQAIHAAGAKPQNFGKTKARREQELAISNVKTVTSMYGETILGNDSLKDDPQREESASLAGFPSLPSRPGGVYSAHDRAAMLQNMDQLKAIQAVRSGAVCIDSTGISQISEIHTDQLFDSIGRFARKQPRIFRVLLSKYSSTRSLKGQMSRALFQQTIEAFQLGFTPGQVKMIVNKCSDNVDMVDLQKFVAMLGGENILIKTKQQLESESKIEKDLEKQMVQTVLDREIPVDSLQSDDSGKTQRYIFCLGFLICPIWCFGFLWISSERPWERRYGRSSALMSVLGFILAIALGAYFVSLKSPSRPTDFCPSFTAVLVSMRVAGPMADIDFFTCSSDASRCDPYQGQYQLKTALHNLYAQYGMDKTKTLAEETVFIDDIEDLRKLPEEGDEATLKITFRLWVADAQEGKFWVNIFSVWRKNRYLINHLARQGIMLTDIFFAPVCGAENTFLCQFIAVPTPVFTEQSAMKNIVLERNVLNSVSPTFSLMKNAPKDISIFSPQWTYHNESWRKTCWFIVLLVIPADQCKTLGSMSCVESGATDYLGSPKREVSVTVKTNSTGDILNVHLRQTSVGSGSGFKTLPNGGFTFGQQPPSYTWFTETDSKEYIKATYTRDAEQKPTHKRDLEQCWVPGQLETCTGKYTHDMLKGEFESYYWLGVTGKFPSAQYAPITVTATFRVPVQDEKDCVVLNNWSDDRCMPFCNKYPECKKIVCEESKNALTPLCVAYSQELKMRKEQQIANTTTDWAVMRELKTSVNERHEA